MKRVRKWLREEFLPAWTKADLLAENRALLAKLERRNQEIRELNAYIDGLETALRSMRRVMIRNEVGHGHLDRDEQRLQP